jgi:hypothetical protein
MARQKYSLDTRVLTAFFLAAMPFVAFGSFVVVNMARTELRETVAAELEQRAVQTKLGIEQYLSEQAVHLRLLAQAPEINAAIAKPLPPPAAEQARKLEQDWQAARDLKLVGSLLENPAAARLRALSVARPSFRQVQLVDSTGRLAAAVIRGGRLFHGENAWFTELQADDGQPRLWVGTLQQPKGMPGTLLEVAYPIHAADGSLAGALRALVDGTELYTVLAPVRVGRSGRAVLLRATDGMILAADESERILKVQYPGFESLRSAMEGFPIAEHGQALFGRSNLRRGSWVIPEQRPTSAEPDKVPAPARLVGFSPVDQFTSARWMVTVEQDQSEALAPVDGITRYLWIHFIGVFATVILLAVYFSFKLEQPVMEEDLHLHEEHVPASAQGHAASS